MAENLERSENPPREDAFLTCISERIGGLGKLRQRRGRHPAAPPTSRNDPAMKGYLADIEHLTEENDDFRHVLYTGLHLQLVLMSLTPGQSIGTETHATHDQFFRIEQGTGDVMIDGLKRPIKAGDGIIVPAGAVHNLTNTGEEPMRLYTLYGPPNHMDALVQATKSEAQASHEVFHGVPTETAP
ncbi:cupin domain-containing protein [Paracoccaceae bacterium Fryx2]|nr:cupin domain-containing protein [Paracoccaceae bacterium Fryx2]